MIHPKDYWIISANRLVVCSWSCSISSSIHLIETLNVISLCNLYDLCLGLVGKVDFNVRHLSSSTMPIPSSSWDLSSSQQCIGSGATQVKEHICYWCFGQYVFWILYTRYHFVCFKFSVLCVYCQFFIWDNMDHACYLPRICCCTRYHCWICAFHSMSTKSSIYWWRWWNIHIFLLHLYGHCVSLQFLNFFTMLLKECIGYNVYHVILDVTNVPAKFVWYLYPVFLFKFLLIGY